MARVKRTKDIVKVEDGDVWVSGSRLSIPQFSAVRVMDTSGANGAVLEVRHSLLNNRQACKIWLQLRLGDDRDKLKQGLAEASKLAMFDHPNIARVVNAGLLGDKYFYTVMEYIDGKTLKQIAVKEVTTQARAEFYWRPVRSALSYLYSLGELHGDLHAGNVMVVDRVGNDPEVKIIDLGTSKFSGGRDPEKRERANLVALVADLLPEWGLESGVVVPSAPLQAFLDALDGFVQIRATFDRMSEELRNHTQQGDIERCKKEACYSAAVILSGCAHLRLKWVANQVRSCAGADFEEFFLDGLLGCLPHRLRDRVGLVVPEVKAQKPREQACVMLKALRDWESLDRKPVLPAP